MVNVWGFKLCVFHRILSLYSYIWNFTVGPLNKAALRAHLTVVSSALAVLLLLIDSEQAVTLTERSQTLSV